MPFKCAVFCCPHKSWIHKNLTFYSFPKDSKLKRKWIVALKTRTMDYHWQASDRVCSAHFPRGHYNRDKDIPAIFPRKDKKADQIVWPVDISNLLKPKGHTTTVSCNQPTENVDIACSKEEKIQSEADNHKSLEINGENSNVQTDSGEDLWRVTQT